MDKVEYRELLRNIKSKYLKKDYEGVIIISKELELDKIKENSVLEMVSRAYEHIGHYEIARDILLVAYRRTPSGKRMAYNLAMLCVKLDDLDNAVMFYEDFCKMAPKDNKRYILKYEIGKAGGVPIKDLIRVLEIYNSKEMDEKWQFELASLYNEIGKGDKCAAACDQLLLWYAHGEYERKALELKKEHKPLSSSQQARLDALLAHAAEEEEKMITDEDYDIERMLDIQQIDPENAVEVISPDTFELKDYRENDEEKVTEEAAEEAEEIPADESEEAISEESSEELIEEPIGEPAFEEIPAGGTEGETIEEASEENTEKAADETIDETVSEEVPEEVYEQEVFEAFAGEETEQESDKPVMTFAEEEATEDNDGIAGQFTLESMFQSFSQKLSENRGQAEEIEANRVAYIMNQVNDSHDSSALEEFDHEELHEYVDKVIEPEVPLLEREAETELPDDGGVDLYTPIPEFEFEKRAAGVYGAEEPADIPEEIEDTKELSLDATQFISATAISAEVARLGGESLEVEPSVIEENQFYSEIDPGSAKGRVAVGSVSEEPEFEEIRDDEEDEYVWDADSFVEKLTAGEAFETVEDKNESDGMPSFLGMDADAAIAAFEASKAASEESAELNLDELFAMMDEPEEAEELIEEAEVTEEIPEETEEVIEDTVEEATEEIVEETEMTEEATEEIVEETEMTEEALEEIVEETETSEEIIEAVEEPTEEAAEEIQEAAEEISEETEETTEEAEAAEEIQEAAEEIQEVTEEVEEQVEEPMEEQIEETVKEPDEKGFSFDELFGMIDEEETAAEEPSEESGDFNLDELLGMMGDDLTGTAGTDAEPAKEPDLGFSLDDFINPSAKEAKEPDLGFSLDDFINPSAKEPDLGFSLDDFINPSAQPKSEPQEEPKQYSFDDLFGTDSPERISETQAIPTGAKLFFNKQYRLNEEQKAELAEFLLIDGMEGKICATIERISAKKRAGDPTGGHLIVTGDAKSGKTYLIISILKAVNHEAVDCNPRVAKVQAEAINGKNFKKVLAKVKGADIIVENIGLLTDETVENIIEAVRTNDSSTMVILEGNALAADNISNNHPELRKTFKTRIDIAELSLNEWADIAIEYARDNGYQIDDVACLALHAKIAKCNTPDIRLGFDVVRGIVDEAMEKADKRNSGKLFSAFSKKNGALVKISEQDFM